MNENTINTEMTMRDTAPAGGAKRFRVGGEILGRYVVESELGQGGMGVVYLCFDKVGGVKVAVKGLPPEVSHNSDEMESVRENFRLVSELQHPNIAGVRTLEVDAATGDYYLIMAYARGTSLKHWMRQHGGKRHRAEQLKVLRQIALALDYAHNAEPRHVIHRDIKPENIMVDERGNVSVLDFGLAAQVRSSLSRVSQLVTSRSGTPAYKSPEQWLAQPQRAPSDQYALGVIAYQMYSGVLPYDSDDVEILKHAVAFDPVPEIPDEDKDTNAVFAKVLAKKADERFPSCVAFVDALEGKRSTDLMRERMGEEAERKRREEAELISLGASIDSLKQAIKNEHDAVSSYLSVHPEYLDSRQVAAGLKGLVYEEPPKDLKGIREFHQRLEMALVKMKGLIASLDLVVCATVDGEEVDGAKMLYGTRVLQLPVRIKRRQRLSEEEGYQVTYSRGGQEYVGWFSPSRVKRDDDQCVMVPLRKFPTTSALSKSFIRRNCRGFLSVLLLSSAITFCVSKIISGVAFACTGNGGFVVYYFWGSAVVAFIPIYAGLLRRGMGGVLCGRDDYCVREHSAFNESELLLDRRDQSTAKRSREGRGNKGAPRFLAILKASCVALAVAVFIECIAKRKFGVPVLFGVVSMMVTFSLSYKRLIRRGRWNVFIDKDEYKDNALKQAKARTCGVATTTQTSSRSEGAEPSREKQGTLWKRLMYVAGILLLACGVCVLVFWLLDGFSEGSAAGASRRRETLRSEIAREREPSARVRPSKAETEQLASEKRKAEAERVAAEAAARKEREEAERLASEKRKAEAERAAAEESVRKARAEAERAAAEEAARKARAEAELRRQAEAERLAAEKRRIEEARLAAKKAEVERKAKEDAERKAREAAEAEKVRKLREALTQVKQTAKSVREEAAMRTVPTSDRTRKKFDGTPTMALLKFSSNVARWYYEKAAESARDGAHNKAAVRAHYDNGRACGGPEWPELEAWLEWWK